MGSSPPHRATLGALVQDYVGVQCGVILGARPALEAGDENVVHPVRVAIRRLRATLRTFGTVYEADDRSSFAEELRWAGTLLGDVRDLQVLAERFTGPDAPTAPAARELIAARIESDRAAAWSAWTDAVASGRGEAFFATIARWQSDPPFARRADDSAAHAAGRVEGAEARLRKRLRRAGTAAFAGDRSASALLHDARKAAKRHRYAVELAAPTLGSHAEETIERSQAVQDALGEHQDAVVALTYLQQFDARGQRPEIAAALSEIIARTKEYADDVAGAMRETQRLRG